MEGPCRANSTISRHVTRVCDTGGGGAGLRHSTEVSSDIYRPFLLLEAGRGGDCRVVTYYGALPNLGAIAVPTHTASQTLFLFQWYPLQHDVMGPAII
jgi:hypothetical protein